MLLELHKTTFSTVIALNAHIQYLKKNGLILLFYKIIQSF